MKTAILFSGQGAQYPGMGKDLYDNYRVAKEVFNIGSSILGRDLATLCFEATQQELNLTHNTQVCMLAVDLASGYVLKEMGIMADCVAGFSLGEYAALVYAGVMRIEDAFRLVQVRADAMQNAVPVGEGAMAALMGINGLQANEICSQVKEGFVAPANYNSPIQTVISGDVNGVNSAIEIAEKMGYTAVRLSVSAPFHCKLMEPAASRIRQELETITLNTPTLPLYMNVTGKVIRYSENISELIIEQAMSPVYWIDILRNMKADEVETFIECGVGKTLWGLTKRTLKGVRVMRAVDLKSVEETVQKLKE